MDLDEREWVERVRAGDAEAFRGVVDRYSRTLWRAAWRILGDAEAAEDAVQEAFLRAWRSFATFDDRAELSTWLYRIAVNAAIDLRRKRRRTDERTAALPETLDGDVALVSAEPDAHRRAVSGELARRTRATLAELSPAERTAFLLRHYEGRPIAEIARQLGKNENATKQSIFRAVRKLRLALAPLAESPHAEPA
jgi:RNA polymerase sigma-70 factor (ECF subfamily)